MKIAKSFQRNPKLSRVPWLLAILVSSMLAVQTGNAADTPETLPDAAVSKPVERSFQAVIVSADPANHTIRVRHKPTGFEADVVWDDKSAIRVSKYADFDEVPEGWVECEVKIVDSARKAVYRFYQIEPLAEAETPQQSDELKARSKFRCKLIRVPATPEMRKSHTRLLTRDEKLAYALDINGEIWSVDNQIIRYMSREAAGSTADLVPGMMDCRALVYRQESQVNRLVSAVVQPAFGEKDASADPTGCTVEQFQKGLETFRAQYCEAARDLRKRMPVRLHVTPQLAAEGEPMVLTIEAWAQKMPNAVVTLDRSYLLSDKAQQTKLTLEWQKGETADGLTKYMASHTFSSLPIGQHRLTWTCDIGGDIPEFRRSFAVAGPGTLVAALHIGTGVIPAAITTNFIPHDRWQYKPTSAVDKLASGQAVTAQTLVAGTEASKLFRQEGIEPVFGLSGGTYSGLPRHACSPHLLFSAEPEAVQEAVLAAILEVGEGMGFERERVSFFGYEIGSATVRLARKLGLTSFAAFCSYANFADGGVWLINHGARPLQPYFASNEDFRKPAPRSKDAIVMINQFSKHAMPQWEYFLGALDISTLNDATGGFVSGDRCGRKEVDDIYLSRVVDVVEGELQLQASRKTPFFFDFDQQDFRDKEGTNTRANALFIDYLVRRAREGANIVFCQQRGEIEYYQRHYAEIPETVDYEPNYQCGTKAYASITTAAMPVDYTDVMEIESSRHTAWFKKNEGMLPAYHWDYTKPWNYPDWGNFELPRYRGSRNLRCDTDDRYKIAPLITDIRKMKVTRVEKEQDGALEVTVTLDTPVALTKFPLGLWDIPREWKAGEGWWKVSGTDRFVPIRAPYTGNLNGILEVDAKPGKNEYRLTIITPKRVPQSQDILLKTVHAKVFTRDNQTMAYIWPMQPWETSFELTVPEGKSVQYYAAPKGERVDLPPGKHRLTINKESWSRIVGLDLETLRSGIKEDAATVVRQ